MRWDDDDSFFSWYFICDTLSYPGPGHQILMVTLREPATMTLMDVGYMVDDGDQLVLHQLFSVRTLSRCHRTPVDVVTYALGPQCKAGVYFWPPSCSSLFADTWGMDKILSINKFYTNLIFESFLHFFNLNWKIQVLVMNDQSLSAQPATSQTLTLLFSLSLEMWKGWTL